MQAACKLQFFWLFVAGGSCLAVCGAWHCAADALTLITWPLSTTWCHSLPSPSSFGHTHLTVSRQHTYLLSSVECYRSTLPHQTPLIPTPPCRAGNRVKHLLIRTHCRTFCTHFFWPVWRARCHNRLSSMTVCPCVVAGCGGGRLPNVHDGCVDACLPLRA